jgi:aminoacrylate hydrolase
MTTLQTQDISLHYDLLGDPSKPPLLMIAGLGGTGASWGAQVERFARDYRVVLPDQRGTGQTTRSAGGYTTAQLATDFASLLDHLALGPVHVVGTSTGGAIAQMMALDHAQHVRTITLASSFAHFDDYVAREMGLRRKLMADADTKTIYDLYALFLFSPRFTRAHPATVAGWIERVAAVPPEREVSLKRIDMIAAHDTRSRLHDIRTPTLVLCGDHDVCTPPQLSEDLAQQIHGAELVVLPGGHMLHMEQEAAFYDTVHAFISRTAR